VLQHWSAVNAASTQLHFRRFTHFFFFLQVVFIAVGLGGPVWPGVFAVPGFGVTCTTLAVGLGGWPVWPGVSAAPGFGVART
jgi:hypothetical protein